MKLSVIPIAFMAGYARAFVGPAVQLNGFVRPARVALSTQAVARPSSSSTEMSIAIVTVRGGYVDMRRRGFCLCLYREPAYAP